MSPRDPAPAPGCAAAAGGGAIVAALALVLMLAGCEMRISNSSEGEPESTGPIPAYPKPSQVTVYTDRETGCRYLIAKRFSEIAITPKLRADGKPDCPGAAP